MILNKSEIERCLKIIRSIGCRYRLTDMHVHPFEVVYGTGRYAPSQQTDGIWSTEDSAYVPPRINDEGSSPQSSPVNNMPAAMRDRFAMIKLRRLYAHTGPRCMGDQMSMCGLS